MKIEIVNNYKCIGMYLDSQMTYKKIHYFSNKLSKIIYINLYINTIKNIFFRYTKYNVVI